MADCGVILSSPMAQQLPKSGAGNRPAYDGQDASASEGRKGNAKNASTGVVTPSAKSKGRPPSASPEVEDLDATRHAGGDAASSGSARTPASKADACVAAAAGKKDKGSAKKKSTGAVEVTMEDSAPKGGSWKAGDAGNGANVKGLDDSVGSFLTRLGLAQYLELFEKHHVDDTNLHFLDKASIKSFGIPSWGHVHAIWRAVLQRRKDLFDMGEDCLFADDDGGAVLLGMPASISGKKKSDKGLRGTWSSDHDMSNRHEDLKYVYEQMENIKMHFEAQIEQLNRELQMAKDEITSLKRGAGGGTSQHAGAASGSKSAAVKGAVQDSESGPTFHTHNGNNATGKSGSQKGNKTQKRRDTDEDFGRGGPGSGGGYMRSGSGGNGGYNQQPYNQNQMGYGPPQIYPSHIVPQFYYNNVGMQPHMQGGAGNYDNFDQSGQYYMMQQQGVGDGGPYMGGMGYGPGQAPVRDPVSSPTPTPELHPPHEG